MLVCVRVCVWLMCFLLGTAAVQTEFPKIGFINTSKTGALSKGDERDREAPRRLCSSSLCRVLLTLVCPQFSSMIASIHDIWKPQVTHSSLERELWEVIHRYLSFFLLFLVWFSRALKMFVRYHWFYYIQGKCPTFRHALPKIYQSWGNLNIIASVNTTNCQLDVIMLMIYNEIII